ncbi:TLC domain-containing protein 5-like isoform X2 [Mytilus californianus]|uniref:TLC domain-containing protein 5-like isoform X2 n=2 Tax=Mytilus californianus TaxID=6549 RepID=UPI0022475007|nr:TLC domain-containing protein 5-like isoform X2 [Mytilus californianus]
MYQKMEDPEQIDSPNVMLTVALYSSIWCTLYFTLCLVNYKRSYEWNVRLVTALHALTVTGLGLWCAFVQGPWPFTDAGGRSTPLQQQTICICLGYFLFDMSWCMYYQTEGPAMLIHHILSIAGLSVCAIKHWYGTELIACIIGSEASNPLLQLRWFLRETGKYETILGEIVDLAFMLLFGGLRIGVGTNLLYSYFNQDTDWLGRIGGSALYALSWLFMVNILTFACKKYTKKIKKWKASSADEHSVLKDNNISDKSEVVATKDNNHNVRSRKVHQNGFITSKNIQNKYIGSVTEQLATDDVIEFSVSRTDVITS